jgi:opacity protein-like surface antigen
MNVGTDGLAYFKVGYTGASVKSSQGSASATENLSGYSLGLGYKQFFSGNWYGFGEANYFSYGNSVDNQSAKAGTRTLSWSTTLNANVYNLLVGVGYKF